MNEGLAFPSVDTMNNKIYVAGGFIDANMTYNQLQEYDPGTGGWTLKQELPLNIGHHVSGVIDGKLYVAGGNHKSASGAAKASGSYVYDPATDVWDPIAPMNSTINQDVLTSGIWQASSCVLDGKLYAFGGYRFIDDNQSVATSEMYDPEKDVWTDLAEMPFPVSHHASVVYEDKIYLFGGTTESNYGSGTLKPSNRVFEYDPSADSWQEMEPMPFAMSLWEGHRIDNYLYLVGGDDDEIFGGEEVGTVWRFNLDSLKACISATGISLDRDSLELVAGQARMIVIAVTPANACDPSRTWTSGNDSIATIADGTITGVAAGETYIYVTTSDGKLKDSCFVTVTAAIEVEVICDADQGSDHDDMCIWLHPEDPAQSTIISSDKDKNELVVYDLNGDELYSYSPGHRPGNIDIIYNFPLNGEFIDLIGFNARDPSPPQFVFYTVDQQTRELVELGSVVTTDPWSAELYGFCLYRSPNNHEYYAFGSDYQSRIQQYRVFDDGTGKIAMEHKRTWQNGSANETEGMVTDLERGLLYAGNEQQGIYVYKADEGETTDTVRFIPVKESVLAADVEGLTIYYAKDGKGYLIASSQGQNYFSVFEREGDNDFVRRFSIRGVERTDGIDVLNVPLNSTFSSGIFACHNDKVEPHAVHLVKWEDIALHELPHLLIDTEYSTGIEQSNDGYKAGSIIYPNPANKMINIVLKGEAKYTIEITSVNGQLMLNRELEGAANQVDISSFQKGIYFITIRSKDFITTRKIIKM
jgi:3-phytase